MPALFRYFKVFQVHSIQWLIALSFMAVYLGIMFGARVPSFSYELEYELRNGTKCGEAGVGPCPTRSISVACGTRGDLSPACSASRYIDYLVIGYAHMYSSGEFVRTSDCSSCTPADGCPKPLPCHGPAAECARLVAQAVFKGTASANSTGLPAFADAADCLKNPSHCAKPWCYGRLDPEGTLTSIPAVVTTYTGFHFGMVLYYFESHRDRLMQWVPLSSLLFVAGLVLEVWWPANKQLWSSGRLTHRSGGGRVRCCGAWLRGRGVGSVDDRSCTGAHTRRRARVRQRQRAA